MKAKDIYSWKYLLLLISSCGVYIRKEAKHLHRNSLHSLEVLNLLLAIKRRGFETPQNSRAKPWDPPLTNLCSLYIINHVQDNVQLAPCNS